MDYEDRELSVLFSKVHCGLGSVIIPSNVDRETYIESCFTSETVSIYPEAGGMSYNKVPISLEALQHIEFPKGDSDFGSYVVYLFHPKTRFPIIVAVLDKKNEMFGVKHKQFKFFKENEGNFVSVVGDGKKGNLYVSVKGTEDVGGGKILINAVNGSKKGVLRLQIQGDIEFVSENFNARNLGSKFVCEKTFDIETETVKIDASEKISLGSDNYEPVVLGDKLKSVLSDLCDAITKLTVPTAVGPSGTPVNSADFIKIKNELDKILSEKVETE